MTSRDAQPSPAVPDAPTAHLEVERSYDIAPGTSVPDLTRVPGVAAVRTLPTRRLDATYVDTAQLALARSRATLRRRTGGTDDGWHLKLPGGAGDAADGRRELHGPLTDALPEALVPAVARLAEGPLLPLVRVRNDRTTTELLDAQGQVLAELCDDHVRTTGLRPGLPDQEWTEWECELVAGDEALLDRVEEALLAAGATRLRLASKLARAMGPLAASL